jgi:RNA polymerase sigma-70 factor (ECF subfamily)
MAEVDDDVGDAYLARRAQEGYLDAYELLVDRHVDRVYRVALRLLNNHHDAEDVTQESFIRAWQSLPRYRHDATFSTWLYRIVTNRAISHVQRRGRQPEVPLDRLSESAPVQDLERPESQVVAKATEAALREAIAALPLEQRVTLVLAQFEGLSYIEIANVRGTSVPAVRSQLLRARRTLGRQLTEWR